MGPASGDLVLLRSQPTPLSPSISASLLTPLPSSQSSPVFTSSPSPSRLQIASISPGKSFASLGRTAASSPLDAENSPGPPRRSSLGDLKIPARITMAQTGLRNNLGMVREFATNVDRAYHINNGLPGSGPLSDARTILV
ncbi:hypothetical protein BOTBODRAFT_115189 [Botryobasidium botryosum FD-172 SS1]|uniref:Uncharacterized protein n=1 Tax=Botryobasidium botryosum (strain FD-172 SS1) TaxID=930990 RepID=A0A067MGC4_BOTB1|nr:hypothetical protein BOTBODRAFT_115189 [Botryobasidium botryosum FD-172 SS1]